MANILYNRLPPGIDLTHSCIEYRVVNVTLRYNATFIERQKAVLIIFFIIFVNCLSLLVLPIVVILGTVTSHVKSLQLKDTESGQFQMER